MSEKEVTTVEVVEEGMKEAGKPVIPEEENSVQETEQKQESTKEVEPEREDRTGDDESQKNPVSRVTRSRGVTEQTSLSYVNPRSAPPIKMIGVKGSSLFASEYETQQQKERDLVIQG